MLLFLVPIVVAIDYLKIPTTGSPPSRTTAAAAVYDPIDNIIITFGGFNYQLNAMSSALKTFSLQTLTWGELTPHSNLIPPGLESTQLYLRSDRKLFVFFGSSTSGTSNEIYCFNLKNFIWTIQELTGETIYGRDHFGFTSFEYNGDNYVAIFGGLTHKGLDNTLYLINVDTFEAKKMTHDGARPGLRIGTTLVYRERVLYMYGYIRIELAFDSCQSGIYAYSLDDDIWTLLTYGVEPEERFLHYSYVYNDEMYVIFGARVGTTFMSKNIWKYNFDNEKWSLIKDNIKEFRVEAATLSIGSKVYILYGREDLTIYNTLVVIDLATNPVDISTLSPLYDTPLKRMHHCSFTINTYIYVFGGLYEYGIYLNDLWRYDILLDYWMPISSLGDIPTPRARFACTKSSGNSFAIYGGTDGIDIFDDLYFFQEALITWIKAPVIGYNPSPRHSACMTYYNYKYYILGGQDLEKGFNELWAYDYVSESYTAASLKVLDYALINHNCWLESYSDYISINILGGSTFWNYPNSYWVELRIDNDGKVSPGQNIQESGYFMLSENGIAISENRIYMLFGSFWEKIVVDSVVFVEKYTHKELNKTAMVPELSIYGHSVSHYSNFLYVFGGGTSAHTCKLLNTATNIFFKITNLLSSQDGLIDCSPGTIPPDCTPCEQGTYYYNKTCVPCPKGKYSDTFAATSIEQCIPCASGYFSDIEGAVYCFQCPAGKKCPIGSSSFENNIGELFSSNVQPKAYEGSESFISYIVTNIWYSILSLCLIVLVCVVLMNSFWDKIYKFDMFTSNHSHHLGKPIVNMKTNVGGLFSLFFIFAAIVTATAAVLSYSIDNITEIKTLIPLIALDYDIAAESVDINTTFYMYGGVCEFNNSCVSDILYTINDLAYESISLTCIMENSNCQVNFHFSELNLKTSISSINIEMREKLSYASYLSVNISSTSSIPSKFSSAFIPVGPESSDYILRGTTPSIISYKFTPSVFTSESSRWPSLETGFHISSYEDITIGSVATQKTVNTQVYLRALISITKSDTGMKTQRILNSSLFVFIGSLLGSIFGLMGSFGAAMSFSESFLEIYQNKMAQKKKIRKISKNMNQLKGEFGEWKIKKKGNKVFSCLNFTNTTMQVSYEQDFN